MRRLGKWVLIVLAAVLGAGLLIAGVGLLLPQSHVASSAVEIGAPVDSVWAVVRDFERYAAWWEGARRMERLPDVNGHETWGQHDQFGGVTPLEIVAVEPPHRLVARIAGDDLPFGGTWTYEIGASPAGSTLTITERGEIYNPLFRTLARYVFGYHTTMDGYLESVARRFGADAAPRHLE